MKSYANFILMENLLYNVPRTVPAIATISDILINPRVKIVQRSCDTSLGTQLDAIFLNTPQPPDTNGHILTPRNYSLKIEGVLGPTQVPSFFTQAELSVAIANGNRLQRSYHPFSCTAKGGICQICAYSAYVYSTAKLTAGGTTYEYFEAPAPFSVAAPAVGSSIQLNAGYGRVKGFLSPSQKALFSYLANTYSGSLLGVRNFSNFPLPVNTTLYELLLNKNLLAQAENELAKNSSIPKDVIAYIENIQETVEKALMIVVTYTMYGPKFTAPISNAPDIVL